MTTKACRPRVRRHVPRAMLLSAAVLLAACGAPVELPDTPSSQPRFDDFRVTGPVRARDGQLGIGPAFRYERPQLADLETITIRDGVRTGSWRWSDPDGRDGSAGAPDVLGFLKSMQKQAAREAGTEVRLAVPDFGPRKTVRMGQGIRQSERELVLRALRNMNAVLPWRRRLRLGADVPEILAPEAIPDGEIHLHVTNGRQAWPGQPSGQPHPEYVQLGAGGSVIDWEGETPRILKGYAWIDRNAVPGDRHAARMELTITHELLHAYGIGAHADPDMYPASLLGPLLPEDPGVVPPLFASLEGEVLLAMHRIAPGTPVQSLDAGSLGLWEERGFHLAGSMDAEGGGPAIEFGATLRNGLARPWAAGPRPAAGIRDNPELAGRTEATWSGTLLGFDRTGQTVTGSAAITMNPGDWTGQARFGDIETWGTHAHPGTRGSGRPWQDGDLDYAVTVSGDGASEGFVSIPSGTADPGTVAGVFTGERHAGATGILEHPELSGAFGTRREP